MVQGLIRLAANMEDKRETLPVCEADFKGLRENMSEIERIWIFPAGYFLLPSAGCLENPKDGGARLAAVCGVAQSRTRLKRLSSSSSKDQNGQRE